MQRNATFYSEDENPVSVADLGPDFYSSGILYNKAVTVFRAAGRVPEGEPVLRLFAILCTTLAAASSRRRL